MTTTAIATIVTFAGAGTAPADVVDGYGYVGQYWCEGDNNIKTKTLDGWISIHVAGSAFDGQGQTMQFKAIDPYTTKAYGYSGWFGIPNQLNNVAFVTTGTRFKICATFGGGPQGIPFEWWGNVEY